MALTTLTAGAALLGVSAGSAGAATSASDAQVSSNWAGYVAGSSDGSTQFSNVSGSWVQPTSTCSSGQDDAAFWVGIGGDDGQSSSDGSSSLGDGSSTSLEQIGTEGNCTGNGTQYYAWYELVPSAPVQLNLTIHPGDHISASVGVSGSSTSFSLKDETTGQSFSQTVQSPNPDTSSAEWVAEAPSQCDGSGNCTPLPLSDFGTVDFSNATATANGHTGPISDSDWSAQPIALGSGGSYDVSYGSGGNTAGATPSTLSSGGSSFSVSWSQNGAGSSSSQTSGSSGGNGNGGYGDGGYGYGGYPGGYGGYGGGGYSSGGYSGYGDGGYGYGYVYGSY
ncbi:MAG: G1 family glutamic endopeptidase [Solirubrobacteraceae bacterium]